MLQPSKDKEVPDRANESPSPSAGIEVEDAADRVDLRYVGMPRDDHVDEPTNALPAENIKT